MEPEIYKLSEVISPVASILPFTSNDGASVTVPVALSPAPPTPLLNVTLASAPSA